MRFLVDADLSRSTARALIDRGHQSLHVSEIGLGTASDRQIFEHAQATQSVLVTRDLDFTDPLQFPDTTHCGLMIVRIRETLPPAFVNETLFRTLDLLHKEEIESATIIIEEACFRRRSH